MNTVTTTTPDDLASPSQVARRRSLHLGRFVFAVLWAGLFVAASSSYGAPALALAVLYPAVDLVALALDARSEAAAGRPPLALYLGMGISAAAAVALAVVGTGDVADVLRVWGAWAVASGVLQLVVGLQRRAQQGQVPLMVSGAISVLAGASFVASAADATSARSVAGYAALGGVFFLVSALRQRAPQT